MKCSIIAEIGINHNGDLDIAKKMIDVAKDCGCDSVKFQKRTIDEVYSKELLDSPRESPFGTTQRDQKEGLEFGKEEYTEIKKYCDEKQIAWFASAWDLKSLEFLDQFKPIMNKISSAMIVDKNFVREVAKRKRHTFISTGMSTKKNIQDTVEIFLEEECSFELMHCVSTYPMKPEHANLKRILYLKESYENCSPFCFGVGYSGHEAGTAITFAAVALGATCIERHITLDRSMYGSDQSSSLAPEGLRRLVGGIRKIEEALEGTGFEDIQECEKEVAEKLRSHLKC